MNAPREHFDVVIVGARCGGSPLGAFLARAGLSVCVIDLTDFPSDTLSTHMFQIGGIEVMQRLGALDHVLATGAPPITSCYMKFEDVDLSGPPRIRPGDVRVPLLCVRRISLDVHLVDAARKAGADVRLNTRMTNLVYENGRVTGVKAMSSGGRESVITADLVVGADGRLSTVARLVRSRRYHVIPSERMSSWAYFRGVPRQPAHKIYYHRKDDDFVVATHADDDLFIVAVCPSEERFGDFRTNSNAEFARTVGGCQPVADLIASATQVTKFRGLTRFEGYFREATGPGWVLVGDSGHFKDPTPGQGISDALRQVEKLSAAILRGFSEPAKRDLALRDWWRWRDADALQHYWFCSDIGKRGPISPVRLEILRHIARSDQGRMDFLDIFLHRRYPREMFGPAALFAATARLAARGRLGALSDAWSLVREDVDRRIQAVRPRKTERKAVDEPHLDHRPEAMAAAAGGSAANPSA
jgi:2-polyprenyl-6-methoxyphenol hydroxylase-like FAD-dependent oxidoreductase